MPKGHRNAGNYVGAAAPDKGVFTIRAQQVAASSNTWPIIPRSGIITYLDAGNTASYPGTGTVWYDLSPSGYNYNIVATAYNSSGPKYMDFNGSYGIAKSAITTDVSAPAAYTMAVWTRIKNSTADWRTFYRPYANDHTMIIESGAWNIGAYDNNSSGFMSGGVSQQDVPGNGTSTWVLLYIRVNNSTSPYWKISWNDTPGVIRGSITNANSYAPLMLGNLGGWGNGNATPSDGLQFWGDISSFFMYNRILSDAELQQLFNATRGRYGL